MDRFAKLALVGMLSAVGCAHPFVAANFDSTYGPRVHAFAIAPIANLSTDPEGAHAAFTD